MEKKNKLFNWLSEDAKKKCEELSYMNLDEYRTLFIKEKFDDEFVYVFSPQLCIVDTDNAGRVHQYNLPGDAGEWTDDKDSYVIAISPSPILDVKKHLTLFSLSIFNYTDLNKELYYGSLIYNNEIFILDPNTHDEINKIKENLANSVEECTYILQNYYTTKRPPHLIYI